MADEIEALRAELVRFVKRKFTGRKNVCDLAEDIVHQAFAETPPEKQNFGYLATAVTHTALRVFKREQIRDSRSAGEEELLWFMDERDLVEEIVRAQDVQKVLDSLQTLKEIERVIITQRYYGDYTFAQIARQNGLKLNTVLSHHRRALEKLRPRLSQFAGEDGRGGRKSVPARTEGGKAFPSCGNK